MHRHYVSPALLRSPSLQLDRDEARHLRSVLRLAPGDPVECFDGAGATRPCVVRSLDRHGITLEPVGAPVLHPPPATRIHLCVCVSKGRRMDWTIEKAVELGAAVLVPAISNRTIVRVDEPEDAADKADRWRRIAIEAARQCGTAWLPDVLPPVPLPQAIDALAACRPLFVAALAADARPLREALEPFRGAQPAAAGWIVGPEGDFTPDELRTVRSGGAVAVSLGSRVLRAETAALYGLCVLAAAWD